MKVKSYTTFTQNEQYQKYTFEFKKNSNKNWVFTTKGRFLYIYRAKPDLCDNNCQVWDGK